MNGIGALKFTEMSKKDSPIRAILFLTYSAAEFVEIVSWIVNLL